MTNSPVSPQQAAQELLKRRAARRSLLSFTEYTHPHYLVGEPHRIIAAELDKLLDGEFDRLMLLVPPRHGKSELASRRFPAYALARNPELQVISTSATATLAEDFGRDVRNIVASPEYKMLCTDGFGTKLAEDSQAKGRWSTDAGGSYFAVGIGGALMGRGADLLIIDDPFPSMKEAQSQRARDEVWNWYTGTAYNRLMPGGKIIVINHRMHEDDLCGRLLEAENHGGDKWRVVNLPAIHEGEAIWPEWYPLEALERIRANTPPAEWSALYMQNPTPEEGTYFKREWFGFYDEPPEGLNKYLSSDFGVTEGDGDATEIGIHGLSHDGTLYLCLDGWGGQRSPDVWIDEYLTLVTKHKPYCEFNEAGVIRRSIEGFLQRRREERRAYGRVEWIPPIGDKAARARALQGMAAMGRVKLPNNEYGQRILADLLKFPHSPDDHTVDMVGLMARVIDEAHPGVIAKPKTQEKPDRWMQAHKRRNRASSWKVA